MCGILGVVTNGGIDEVTLENAGRALAHRGPDDSGIYIKSQIPNPKSQIQVALGHRRLSIIDLSQNAHQPMSNEACPECRRRNGSVWITYNGEIYNYRELREALIVNGHRFKSNSDTEVILHAYEEWDEKCLNRFSGMFAFAIWDEKKQKLLIVRDRIGKKPLFYYWDGKLFAFASELQGLLALNIPRDVDLSAIHLYLTYQYIPAPKSAFKNVYKLPPAHYLILESKNNPPESPHTPLWKRGAEGDFKGGMGGFSVKNIKDGESSYALRIQKYWDIDFSKKIIVTDERQLSRNVFEKLKESVRQRLISDVPFGAFLSGGIDSSIVVALMSQIMQEPVKTFSIGFEEETYNELPYSRQIAKLFKTDHKEFVVKFDALEILPKLVRHYGEPFADSSALPTYYLSKMTSDFVKVALSGDGGDESFAGYDRYYALKLMRWFRHIPKTFRNLLLKTLNITGESDVRSRIKRLKRFIQGSLYLENQEYLQWMIAFSKDDMKDLYGETMLGMLINDDHYEYLMKLFESSTANDMVEKVIDVDIHSYLPFDLLVKVDIASMANSLEVRCPFLDHEFMEFIASVPVEYKLRGHIRKYILKKAFNGLIPGEIFKRRKTGFGVPVSKWFRHELKDYISDVLLNQRSFERGYFNPKAIKKLLTGHISGRVDNSYKLWTLLVLELWHREFID